MVRWKIMRLVRSRQKRVYRCSSREEEDSSKQPNSFRTRDMQQRHAATNLTHTNLSRRNSSQDSYRNSCNFSRNNSSSSLGSDGCGSQSTSVSFDPNQDVPSGSASSSISRQLEMAVAYGPELEELSGDGPIILPLDQSDGNRLTTAVPEAPVKILVLVCPEDEMIGNLFLEYLRRAFPFVEAIDQWEGLYGSNVYDHWQHIVDTISFVFILMSQEFLTFARRDSKLSWACQQMELRGTNIVPVYLENITRDESDFLMDLENRWGIYVQRNGFSNLHRWLKTTLVRHIINGCPR